MNEPNERNVRPTRTVHASMRAAEATAYGAQAAFDEVAELVFNQHALELRLAKNSESSDLKAVHTYRAGMLEDLAGDIQRLCAELKLEAPGKLARVIQPARLEGER